MRLPHGTDTNCDVNRLDQVQKNAARFVCYNYKTSTSTSKLVKSLGWDTLEQRHLFNQSVLFFKFHNNPVNCNIPESVSCYRKLRTTRRHQLCYQQLDDVSSFHYFFSQELCIRLWNLLPYGVVSSDTSSSFKQSALPAIRSPKVPPHCRRL